MLKIDKDKIKDIIEANKQLVKIYENAPSEAEEQKKRMDKLLNDLKIK